MNEDRDTRDHGGESTPDQSANEGAEAADDVWARAAEQARRDMVRAQRRAAARGE